MTESTSRLRPGLMAIELSLIAALFWADERGWIPLSKTQFLLVVAWGSMWLRGVRWRDVGLSLPPGWKRLALIGVAAGIAAWLLALLIVNLGFGLAHLYQGPSGVIQATVGGVLFGVFYIVSGRNLIVPILAHGVSNSIDFSVMYLGWYPGVGS